jgi:hypothetical protein
MFELNNCNLNLNWIIVNLDWILTLTIFAVKLTNKYFLFGTLYSSVKNEANLIGNPNKKK